MRYLGGKGRYAKSIIPFFGDLTEKTYVEPFCGGCAIISQVQAKRRIANDIHPNLIGLLKAVQSGWEPPASLSLDEWRTLRDRARRGEVDPLIGFAGFPCSYGGRWFEGYARTRRGDDTAGVAAVARKALLRQAPALQGIEWYHGPYQDLDIPVGSVVYLDPPYINTKGYSGTAAFDHSTFYAWCGRIGTSSILYLSEQTAPDGWTCIWEHPRTTGLDQDGERKTVVERLFTLD